MYVLNEYSDEIEEKKIQDKVKKSFREETRVIIGTE